MAWFIFSKCMCRHQHGREKSLDAGMALEPWVLEKSEINSNVRHHGMSPMVALTLVTLDHWVASSIFIC